MIKICRKSGLQWYSSESDDARVNHRTHRTRCPLLFTILWEFPWLLPFRSIAWFISWNLDTVSRQSSKRPLIRGIESSNFRVPPPGRRWGAILHRRSGSHCSSHSEWVHLCILVECAIHAQSLHFTHSLGLSDRWESSWDKDTATRIAHSIF